MPVIDTIDKKKYGRLLAQYLPGVVRISSCRSHRSRALGLQIHSVVLGVSQQRTEE